MMRLTSLLTALVATVCLSACGERPQAMVGNKSDAAAFSGTEGPFAAAGWKPGDKTSWEQGLKARMWNSQNEYSKMNPSK